MARSRYRACGPQLRLERERGQGGADEAGGGAEKQLEAGAGPGQRASALWMGLRKAVNGRLAEPHPQGSRPLARASTSLCLVRATVPTLSLQPKLWLTGAIMSAPIVLAEVPRAESVEEIELTRRATTCGQQRCTAATAITRVQAQPSAPPRTHRPRPHNTVWV